LNTYPRQFTIAAISKGSFRVRVVSGTDTCTPISTTFCAAFLSGALGEGDSSEQASREIYAQSTYNELVALLPLASCTNTISSSCYDGLKQLACIEAFRPCDGNGLLVSPDVSLCKSITNDCAVDVSDTLDLPDCDSTFYSGQTIFVPSPGGGSGSLSSSFVLPIPFLLLAFLIILTVLL